MLGFVKHDTCIALDTFTSSEILRKIPPRRYLSILLKYQDSQKFIELHEVSVFKTEFGGIVLYSYASITENKAFLHNRNSISLQSEVKTLKIFSKEC